MTKLAINIENLTRDFGTVRALDNLSLVVPTGIIFGFLGPNGAGKTTTIRMLLGLLEPSDGHAKVLGYDAFHQSEEVRALAGYMSQKFALYDDLTVWRIWNFMAVCTVYGTKTASHPPWTCSAWPGMVLH